MPYESPNIVIVPMKSFVQKDKRTSTIAPQIKAKQNDIFSSNLSTISDKPGPNMGSHTVCSRTYEKALESMDVSETTNCSLVDTEHINLSWSLDKAVQKESNAQEIKNDQLTINRLSDSKIDQTAVSKCARPIQKSRSYLTKPSNSKQSLNAETQATVQNIIKEIDPKNKMDVTDSTSFMSPVDMLAKTSSHAQHFTSMDTQMCQTPSYPDTNHYFGLITNSTNNINFNTQSDFVQNYTMLPRHYASNTIFKPNTDTINWFSPIPYTNTDNFSSNTQRQLNFRFATPNLDYNCTTAGFGPHMDSITWLTQKANLNTGHHSHENLNELKEFQCETQAHTSLLVDSGKSLPCNRLLNVICDNFNNLPQLQNVNNCLLRPARQIDDTTPYMKKDILPGETLNYENPTLPKIRRSNDNKKSSTLDIHASKDEKNIEVKQKKSCTARNVKKENELTDKKKNDKSVKSKPGLSEAKRIKDGLKIKKALCKIKTKINKLVADRKQITEAITSEKGKSNSVTKSPNKIVQGSKFKVDHRKECITKTDSGMKISQNYNKIIYDNDNKSSSNIRNTKLPIISHRSHDPGKKRVNDNSQREYINPKIVHANISEPDKNKHSRESVSERRSRSQNILASRSAEQTEKKRVRRNPSKDVTPSKCIRQSSDNVTSKKSVKSRVQKVDKLKQNHPRVRAPENDSCYTANDQESNFDLRTRLNQISYNHCPKINQLNYDTQTKNINGESRENLVISFCQNTNEEPKTKPPSPPLNPKANLKTINKIKFVINVTCANEEDSSDAASSNDYSDDADVRNVDLSFLDDFNIDEIVNSLKYSPKLENTQQSSTQPITTNYTPEAKSSVKTRTKEIVQPIFIKEEIKTEKLETDLESHFTNGQVYKEIVKENNSCDSILESNTNRGDNRPEANILNLIENAPSIQHIKQEYNNEAKIHDHETTITSKLYESSTQDNLVHEVVNTFVNTKLVIADTCNNNPKVEIFNNPKHDPRKVITINQESSLEADCIAEMKTVPPALNNTILSEMKTDVLESNIVCAVPESENKLKNNNNVTYNKQAENKNDNANDVNTVSINTEFNIKKLTTDVQIKKTGVIVSDQKKLINPHENSPQTKPFIKIAENVANSISAVKPDEKTTSRFTKLKSTTTVRKRLINDNTEIKSTPYEPNIDLARLIEEKILHHLHEELSVMSLIWKGRYSNIFKCQNKTGQHYAVKVLSYEYNSHFYGSKKMKMIKQFQNDMPKENLNTVYFYKGFALDNKWCFLMDYYPINLQQAINERVFHLDEVQVLGKQLVSAVMMLRNNNIVHTDIKPSHILFDSFNKKIKLCGFDYSLNSSFVKVLPSIGTVNYRAPEIIVGFSAGFSIDVWSTALVMYEMATCKKLFPGTCNNKILHKQMCLMGNLPKDMMSPSTFGSNFVKGRDFYTSVGYQGHTSIFIKTYYKTNKLHGFLLSSYHRHWHVLRSKSQTLVDMEKLNTFHKLLDQMLGLDPRTRLSIERAYLHPFFVTK